MATAAAVLRKTETAEQAAVQRDEFRLRPLPHEDVFFYCKKIDNSRLVREADPAALGSCWKAIGVASLAVALLTGVLAPSVAGTVAGYRLQALRTEQRRLADERQSLELQEAELLSPQRMQMLATDQNLVKPSSAQVVHLNNRADSAVAMVKSK
jgi:hypothetical protein